MKPFKAIAAMSENRVIGCAGRIPWHLPEDLAHFKRLTLGCPVIMGRRTWDSLPARFRPLPGRLNLVVTRQGDWHEPGAQRAGSLEQALALCPKDGEVWVIGGAQLYQQALPLAHSAQVTEIEAEFEGDAFAPQFGPHWKESARERHIAANGMPFSFVTYTHTGV